MCSNNGEAIDPGLPDPGLVDPGLVGPGLLDQALLDQALLDQALLDQISRISRLSVAGLSDAQLSTGLAAVLDAINALEATASELLAAAHQRGLCRADGSLSTQVWLTRLTRMGRREAHRRVRTAVALRELPQVRASWASGGLWRGHAEAVARAADCFGAHAVAAGEHNLLLAAAQVDAERFAASLRNARHLIDPQRHGSDTQAGLAMRYLNVSTTFEGFVRLDGLLDPEAGVVVRTAIAALAAPEPLQDAPDTRDAGQRRADALTELCRRVLDVGLPEQAGERPHVSVVVPVEVLAARAHQGSRSAGAAAAPGVDGQHRVARIDGYEGLPTMQQVRRFLCDAQVTRIVTGPRSLPLDVGRAARTVTGAQRRALRVRDGRCRFPGCERPFGWTDAHHVVHWVDGGNTDLDNLLSLCRRHHRHVHELGWVVSAHGQGRFGWADPSGREVTDPHVPPDFIDAMLAATLGGA